VAVDSRNSRSEALSYALEQACKRDVFPGCVALVWRDGALVYHRAHGVLATEGSSSVAGVPANRETVYDLASLTKVLCTTTLFARLIECGRVRLQDRLPVDLRPRNLGANALESDESAVPTLGMLLEHTAGLQAHREYFLTVECNDHDHGAMVDAILETPALNPVGREAIYSDLGFVLLGAWLERLEGCELHELFDRDVARPLGLDSRSDLGFRPLGGPACDAEELRRIAPTEVYARRLHSKVPSWFPLREHVACAHGEVHDDNAYCMGGVAGHAGLFGHAEGLLRVAMEWLRPGALRISGPTRAQFFRSTSVQGATRCKGWDGVDFGDSSSTGGALAPGSVGHLGFTGTSLWLEPGLRPSIYILLSNRVHPSRDNQGIRGLRQEFHRIASSID